MDVPPEDQMRNQEQQPLLDEGIGMYSDDMMTVNNEEPEYITEYGDGAESAQRAQRPNGATVLCRVCDVAVSLEGRNQQHVVKCHSCDEATPIRPAPPGKKYVRCPCKCLLICKASSTRIACPRNNCRRFISMGNTNEQLEEAEEMKEEEEEIHGIPVVQPQNDRNETHGVDVVVSRPVGLLQPLHIDIPEDVPTPPQAIDDESEDDSKENSNPQYR